MNDIECYYCSREGKKERAVVTMHDRRGCYHTCWKHAQWRMTTSWLSGHSADCEVAAARSRR